MNRASGDVAASSQDTQRQMQGQPTAAQQAEGAKPGSPMNSQEAQRQMHAQPSVAEQPKGEEQASGERPGGGFWRAINQAATRVLEQER
jgi:hypothetical protein